MTVAELIEQLQKFPLDLPVCIETDEYVVYPLSLAVAKMFPWLEDDNPQKRDFVVIQA